jgi:hypothetical protein
MVCGAFLPKRAKIGVIPEQTVMIGGLHLRFGLGGGQLGTKPGFESRQSCGELW